MVRDTLIDFFGDLSRARGQFLVYDDGYRRRAHSYEDVGRAARGFAAQLAHAGLAKDDKVVFEQYWRGNTAETPWTAWSVSKSFTSALVGVAVHDGAIASIEDPITKYLPELKGSAYDGVRIKDALQMSSGASWNEDYSNSDSDVNRFGRTFALGGSLDAFVGTLTREHAPGSFNRYNSMDAQVLGMILRRTTGKTEAAYLEEKLWSPLGMESDAYWVTDDKGVEFAAGGLSATLRDFAKLGRLYLDDGRWNGAQIVPVEVPGVIGVSAVGNFRQTDGDSDPNDYLKSFYSSFGVAVTDLTAPGGDSRFFTSEALPNGRVLSTWPSDLMADCLRPVVDPGHPLVGYCYQQGTSMASPHVAGVAALIISRFGSATTPKMRPGQVRAYLTQTADPQPCPTSLPTDNPVNHIPYLSVLGINSGAVQTCQGGPGHNSWYGAGQVDALNAVTHTAGH